MKVKSLLDAGVSDGLFAGAVGLVADHKGIHFLEASGHAVAQHAVMTTETIFDMASITKVLGTTTGIMQAITDNKLKLTDEVARYFPAFRRPELAGIHLGHLLSHRAGLNEWQPLYLAASDRHDVLELIADIPLRYPVGAGRHYSDLGMIVLGAVLEEATGETLPSYLQTTHERLGLTQTRYGPIHPSNAGVPVAATSPGDAYEQQMVGSGIPYPVVIDTRQSPPRGWRRHVLAGEVNDGNCFHALGGIAGHAGLFSTAKDLWRWSTSLMAGCFPDVVSAPFLRPMAGEHSLGFSALLGLAAGPGVMHAGFTGTRVAMFPDSGVTVVLLTNRLHPGPGVPDIEPTWKSFLEAAVGPLDRNRA